MTLAKKIFLGHFLLIVVGFGYFAYLIHGDLNPRYRESAEVSLVDMSTILAAQLAQRLQRDPDHWLEEFEKAFAEAGAARLQARVYDLTKTTMDMRVYITDAHGIALYDSRGPEAVGKDYSAWNDVLKTLRGEYGARSTRDVAHDPLSSVLYVAAPIAVGGALRGVVTVGKPAKNINQFIEMSRARLLSTVIMLALAIVAMSFVVSKWLSIPVQRLTDYARAVGEGRGGKLPRLRDSEMATLGAAFEEMRETLEGKRYIETYVQTLTHEIKSPLAGIRGAAELLQEEMPASERELFLNNILTESGRIQNLVERLLELSALEARRALRDEEDIELKPLLAEIVSSLAPQLQKREITVTLNAAHASIAVRGERFLIRQAIVNLLQNALDFSPVGGEIVVEVSQRERMVVLSILDRGPGIPEFALSRLFERFYSLGRPEGGKKSSGLGLSFVHEVAQRHGGEISVLNRREGGAESVFKLPSV